MINPLTEILQKIREYKTIVLIVPENVNISTFCAQQGLGFALRNNLIDIDNTIYTPFNENKMIKNIEFLGYENSKMPASQSGKALFIYLQNSSNVTIPGWSPTESIFINNYKDGELPGLIWNDTGFSSVGEMVALMISSYAWINNEKTANFGFAGAFKGTSLFTKTNVKPRTLTILKNFYSRFNIPIKIISNKLKVKDETEIRALSFFLDKIELKNQIGLFRYQKGDYSGGDDVIYKESEGQAFYSNKIYEVMATFFDLEKDENTRLVIITIKDKTLDSLDTDGIPGEKTKRFARLLVPNERMASLLKNLEDIVSA